MMGGVARIVGIASVGVVCACNVITGADGLSGDPSDSTELPSRRREETASAPIDNGASSTSSSGGSSSGSSGDPDAGATVDAAVDAPTLIGGSVFFDDFNRADDANVGNGWIEKVDSFSIASGAVRQTGLGSYRDLIVRRPEVALDVELSVNVTHNRDIGDPALYARMQPVSSNLGTLVGYSFFAIRDFVEIDRDEGSKDQYTVLASQTLAEPIVAPYAYSLYLKVTGTNPVTIVATMKDANGNVKATLDYVDSSAARITQPGAVGFGSGDAQDARFEDFKRTTF
jgi:hypothetical protein